MSRSLITMFLVGLLACANGGSRVDRAAASVLRLDGTACLRPIHATAVVVGEGRVLTVAHAIAGADEDLRTVSIDGTDYPVTVIGFDPELDLALLRVEGLDATAIEMGTAAEGDVGTILSISSDLRIERIEYQVARIVTARSGDIYDQGEVLRTALELDADTASGDSGAPLINQAGHMVGMLFARSTESAGSWALHRDEIAAFLDSISGDEEVDRGRCR